MTSGSGALGLGCTLEAQVGLRLGRSQALWPFCRACAFKRVDAYIPAETSLREQRSRLSEAEEAAFFVMES